MIKSGTVKGRTPAKLLPLTIESRQYVCAPHDLMSSNFDFCALAYASAYPASEVFCMEQQAGLIDRRNWRIIPFMVRKNIKDTIKKHNLINAGEHIVIGLSGGPDSVCLFSVSTS